MRGREITVVGFDFKGENIMQDNLLDNAGVVERPFQLPFAALMLTAGTLGDRFGRKRLFLAGLVLFLLGSMLCGFATTLDWFLIQALGQAFVDALHGSFVISGTALLAAALLVVFLQKPKQRSTSGE